MHDNHARVIRMNGGKIALSDWQTEPHAMAEFVTTSTKGSTGCLCV